MVFNSESNKQDLVDDVYFWSGTTSSSYAINDITRAINAALDRVVALIMRSDNTWEWDDSNNTDLPVATTSLVSGQADYSIPITHLKISKIRIKDSNGNWISFDRVNKRDLTDAQLTATNATPTSYYLEGNSVFFNPAPNYASSGGLEITFQRGASYFVPTDTTKAPGFASQFHRLLSLYAALDFPEIEDRRLNRIQDRIDKMEAELVNYYSDRNRDKKPSMATRKEDYGELEMGESLPMNYYNPLGF